MMTDHDEEPWGNDNGYSDYDGDARGPAWDVDSSVYQDHPVRRAIAESARAYREAVRDYRSEWGNSGDGDSGADNGPPDPASFEVGSVDDDAPAWTPPTVVEFQERTRRVGTAVRLRAGRTRSRGVQKTPEGTGMDTMELARRNLERAQREMAVAELKAVRNGVEPPVGSVVAFVKHYERGLSQTYHYAAIRTVLGWYLTGQETGVLGWSELNEFADEGTLRVATGWDVDRISAVPSVVPSERPETSMVEAGAGDLPFTGTRYYKEGQQSGAIFVMEEVRVLGTLIRSREVQSFSGEDASQQADKLIAEIRTW